MKIIFLDFDGVLNSASYLLANPGGMDKLDPTAIERLNVIIDRTCAKVVISSTWRLLYPLQDLRARLKAAGFRGEILDCTPQLSADAARGQGFLFTRCEEIQTWLKAHPDPIESFVILDDADLHDTPHSELHARIIKTDFTTGLLDEHIDWAIMLLDPSD